ncbi:ASCH domain-containing protein [Bacillus sp. CGMCC 1.16607]|uniref:ASCH domain-containing protein n=1 Tax=Bacillus sp. CGMCC 1.16607 TaxID=3351842 RepID=UPI00362EC6B1
MKSMTFWGRNEHDERLLVECLLGLKTATCTPKIWYDALPEEELGVVGTQFEVYTKKGIHACTIETTEIIEIKFGDIKGTIGEKIAKAENSSLDQFTRDHIFTWKNSLLEEGSELNEDTPIIVEFFKLVDTKIDFRELGHRISVLL